MLDKRFDEFLRRGGETPRFESVPAERKFNPYHDPEDGRFTFAPGRGTLATRVRNTPQAAAKPRATPAPRTPRPTPSPSLSKEADHGALSARYESVAGGNPGEVSTGVGDTGGVSYGTHQMSSSMGTVSDFLSSSEGSRWASEFRGLKPGSSAFSDKWKQVAAREASAFGAAQNAYVDRTHYTAAVRSIANRTGMDIETRIEALRQVAYSTAVQHGPGGGAGIFAKAISRADKLYPRSDPRYEASLINSIYDFRVAHWIAKRDEHIKNREKDKARTSNNVVTIRLPEERAIALKLLRGW